MLRPNFPKRLQCALNERGMTTKQLADAIGVNQRTVQKWIDGESTRPSIACRIARAVRCKRSFFIDEPPPGDVGGRIRLLCAMREVTIREAARRAGFPEETVYSWVLHRNNPRPELLEQFAAALDAPAGFFAEAVPC